MKPTSLPLILSILASAALAGAPQQDTVYVSSGVWGYVVAVDAVTGNRQEIFLEDYPLILKSTDFMMEQDGSMLIETVDALKRNGIYRFNPETGARVPVSGGVDGHAKELFGPGPPFLASINTIVRGPESLYVLCDFGGIMEVNPADGARRVVVPRDPPATVRGANVEPPMYGPLDMVMLNASTLLVADQFQQLVLVDVNSGERSRFLPASQFTVTPARVDLLNEHTLIYSGADPELGAIWAVDLHSGEELLYSGSFGGEFRGTGPAFQMARDVSVDSQGRLWLFDSINSALYLISPDGDRTIVSSPTVGTGDSFFAHAYRPVLGTYAQPIPGNPTAWRLR